MDKLKMAQDLRKALELFAQTVTDENALELSTLYPEYQIGVAYTAKQIISYDVDSEGNPQLYRVVQAHTSQSDWKPSVTPSLYTPIKLDSSNYEEWKQPTGAHDAYNKGTIVKYKDKLYRSLIDGNTYSPDAYPAGWEEYTE